MPRTGCPFAGGIKVNAPWRVAGTDAAAVWLMMAVESGDQSQQSQAGGPEFSIMLLPLFTRLQFLRCSLKAYCI